LDSLEQLQTYSPLAVNNRPFARLSRNLLERPLFALLFLAVPLNLLRLFTINLCQLVFRLTMDARELIDIV